MENERKSEPEVKKQVDEIHKEIQPALYESTPKMSKELFEELERSNEEMSRKITDMTVKIANEAPELLKYIDEMPVTIPDVEHPEITAERLKKYYESLELLFERYINEHSENKH